MSQRDRPVDEVEVHVVEPEQLERALQCRLHVLGLVRVVPQLGRDPQLVARTVASRQRLTDPAADLLLVPVDPRAVDVPIADLDRTPHRPIDLVGLREPGSEAEGGDLRAVVEGQRLHRRQAYPIRAQSSLTKPAHFVEVAADRGGVVGAHHHVEIPVVVLPEDHRHLHVDSGGVPVVGGGTRLRRAALRLGAERGRRRPAGADLVRKPVARALEADRADDRAVSPDDVEDRWAAPLLSPRPPKLCPSRCRARFLSVPGPRIGTQAACGGRTPDASPSRRRPLSAATRTPSAPSAAPTTTLPAACTTIRPRASTSSASTFARSSRPRATSVRSAGSSGSAAASAQLSVRPVIEISAPPATPSVTTSPGATATSG